MKKKRKISRWNNSLNILIGCLGGQFIGRAIAQYIDYRVHSNLYAAYSAPWYTGLLINAAISAAVIGIAVATKLLLKRKSK